MSFLLILVALGLVAVTATPFAVVVLLPLGLVVGGVGLWLNLSSSRALRRRLHAANQRHHAIHGPGAADLFDL